MLLLYHPNGPDKVITAGVPGSEGTPSVLTTLVERALLLLAFAFFPFGYHRTWQRREMRFLGRSRPALSHLLVDLIVIGLDL